MKIEYFKVNDKIKNNKTGKIGIVRYHLVGTPNNIHTIVGSEFDRFEIIG